MYIHNPLANRFSFELDLTSQSSPVSSSLSDRGLRIVLINTIIQGLYEFSLSHF